MEENQTVPAMIPEGDFAAFLEGEKVETLLSPLGYAYCAEGQDADLRVKRLERLEVTARRRGATPAQMEDWRMLRDRELDVEWMLNRDSVRSKARWVALQGSPLQTIASVQPREAEYLAEPYLPRGMITILAGHAGQGKTTLALWLASHVSNGDLMPGGKPGNVYYFTTENDESIVLRPRLEAVRHGKDRPKGPGGRLPRPLLWRLHCLSGRVRAARRHHLYPHGVIDFSEDLLPLSGLQHFAFCRRQWALIHLEQQWQENLRTVEGGLLHRRAHDEAARAV